MIRPALVAACSLIAGAAVAHPAMTTYDTTMRAAPSGKAHVVQQIPARAQIDVRDCGDSWCAASWRDIDGFVRVDAVGPNEGALVEPRPYYGGPYYGGPYFGGPYFGGPVFVGPVFGYGYYRHW
jgi:uncharacterized protein YraI